MKKILSRIALALVLAVTAAGCAQDLPILQEELDLERCLVPTELTAKVSNGQDVQFNWSKSKGATLFVLEVYKDEEMTDLFEAFNVTPEELPYTVRFEADKTYYARVKAVDETGKLQDSKWANFEKAVLTKSLSASNGLQARLLIREILQKMKSLQVRL